MKNNFFPALLFSSVFVFVLFFFLSCSEKPPPDNGKPIIDNETIGDIDCDGLNESHCLFPFPSDYFRHTENGRGSLVFGDYVIPSASEGASVDASEFKKSGGWSIITPIYFVLPDALLDGAPPYENISKSLNSESRTLVIEADTGKLMPHWAEFDHFAESRNINVIALRLARRLESNTRYIVAVHGLKNAEGNIVPPSKGFDYLRNRESSRIRGVGGRRNHFESDIFPVIENLGIERDSIQLAWDFTTDTEENVSGTLLAMRDLMMEAVADDGPEYEILEVLENVHENIAVMIRGKAFIPSFLDGIEGDIRRIKRDAEGKPVHEGFEEIYFDVQIPNSVMNGDLDGRLVQYGHGLLGSREDSHYSWLRRQADEYGYVLVAVNMQGMDETDFGLWLRILSDDLGLIPLLSEKPHQGLINHLAIIRMMQGRFAEERDPRFTIDDRPAYDPNTAYYYGNSQGGTLGSVMMSIRQDITRGVLGVPGGAFAFLLTRSTAFEDMAGPLHLLYPDPVDFIAILGLAQVGFDRVDPMNYVHRMTENTFPETPSHRVLLQVGKEDGQVNIQVTDILARTLGASRLVPGVRPVWDLEEVSSPHAGNTMVEFCFGRPDNPRSNYPVDLGNRTDPHSLVRRLSEAHLQIDHFFSTGEVIDVCDGPCHIEGL